MLPMSEHDLRILESLDNIKCSLLRAVHLMDDMSLRVRAKYESECKLAVKNGQN